jgi:metacaspase-1
MARVALCIGINKYGSGSDLFGCVNDAADWSAALSARGYQVTTLLDQEATAEKILERLCALIDLCAYGDICVFTFSGHGSWIPDESGDEPDGRDEILCPVDIFAGRWISDDDLHQSFSGRARGARIVFISDSCHSGTVNRFAAMQPLVAGDKPRRARFLPPGTFKMALADRSSPDAGPLAPTRALAKTATSVLLAGCRDAEYSYDAWFGDRPNGAFTRAALDALAEDPLSYQDWYKMIRTRLPTSEYPQTPQIGGAVYQRRWEALAEGR